MIARLLSLAAGLAAGVATSQAPGFTLQYMQNLDGRVAELRVIVERFEENIARIGYDRMAALASARRLTPSGCSACSATGSSRTSRATNACPPTKRS